MMPQSQAAAVAVPNDHQDEISISSSGEENLMESTSTEDRDPSSERDEVKEVQKMASKDTKSVNVWRLVATAALLTTAFIVTFSTYSLLKNEEKSNFETAFQQFSRTLSEAAVGQQQDLRDGLDQLGNIISMWATSDANNESFPFVTLPNYETIAVGILKQAHAETVIFNPFVRPDQKEAWLEYANAKKGWVVDSHMQQMGSLVRLKAGEETYNNNMTVRTRTGEVLPINEPKPYFMPSWTYSPPPASYGFINLNLPFMFKSTFDTLFELQNETLFSPTMRHPGIPLAFSVQEHARYHSKLTDSSVQNPHSFVIHPVYSMPGDKSSGIAGVLASACAWDASLLNLLPQGVEGIHVVIESTCTTKQPSFTYNIVGGDAIYLGPGDQHEERFDHMEVAVDLALHSHPRYMNTTGHCKYSMHIYPSTVFEQSYDENTPEIFAAVVASTFVFVAVAFFVYDLMQQKRNNNLVHKAAQSHSIVTSLFPEHMRERLMYQAEQKQAAKKKGNLKAFLNDGTDDTDTVRTIDVYDAPLADLYLNTTILFADLAGFTSWSSVREPTQVFTLLEALYGAFDLCARRRRIFKVETVGDCYVAVSGLPEPRLDHAIAMAKFARDILSKVNTLTKELEVLLGPDTGDLQIRIGMHSGPVTAGVLRGERARFQLFGDTMNTCERLEGSGKPSKIHCSKETADLIKKAGKESWVQKRAESVDLKGKGTFETYWVTVKHEGRAASVASYGTGDNIVSTTSYGPKLPGLSDKTDRLIDWNVEMLLRILKQIVARRTAVSSSRKAKKTKSGLSSSVLQNQIQRTPLEEVREIIHLPEFDSDTNRKQLDPRNVEIPTVVVKQLYNLVSVIASLYNDNPFHCFEHASHVLMSVTKLMSRIVAPSDMDPLESAALHDHTYGITSDALTQFACAFSALIHDVDHVGVSNAQLVKEGVAIAAIYNERSVAEQNSLDLSWNLLMNDAYKDLRSLLFETEADLVRFRQLVVNSVMATDICDKEMKELRNGRWEKAFKEKDGSSTSSVEEMEDPKDAVDRKATIVIEYIIQASDISHTMQHWHVYRKWNQNLFEELYVAYLNGRMDKNPAEFWYQGEFGFFDFYIIPITQKLKDCGVFGVSSDEFLNYALKNRQEWEEKGESVVAEILEECIQKYGVKGDKLERGRRLPRGGQALPTETFQNVEYAHEVDV